MPEDNQHNILYFEAPTVKSLFESMDIWQKENGKRFLSTSIQKENGFFCCIALTNPMEVIITQVVQVIIKNSIGNDYAKVTNGKLNVTNT